VARKYFDEIVVNIGRRAGTSLDDVVHYLRLFLKCRKLPSSPNPCEYPPTRVL
jgi:hypothetical protein